MNNLISGDLVKIRVGGEERFGTFDRYGRDAMALVILPGEARPARVRPMDVIENRSEDERRYQKSAGGKA